MEDKPTSASRPGIVANGVGYDPAEINAPGVTVFTLVVIGVLLAVFFGVTLYFEKFHTVICVLAASCTPHQSLNLPRGRYENCRCQEILRVPARRQRRD